jgi:hypothetical protein
MSGQAYHKVLHNQSIHHNVYKRIKSLYSRSERLEWSLLGEGKYEGLDPDIMRAMHHAESQCVLRQKHTEPWSPPIGRATHAICYRDIRTNLRGMRDPANDLLNYYISKSDVEISRFDHDLYIKACIHQINNAISKFKDVIKQETQLRSEFEVDLETAVIEQKHAQF